MGSLVVGSDVIMIKDAINQVNRNIQDLQEKLNSTSLKGYASVQVCKFYEEKIESQIIAREWLARAL